jgi:hypothetical protein
LVLCHPPLSSHLATMAVNRDMIEASMVVAGFCINQHGGAYIHGKEGATSGQGCGHPEVF